MIGFNDGVYDLDRYEFRPFNVNDIVTLSTRYDFPLETEHDQEIETFFEQVFPDTNVRHFMKKFLASCLAGWNEYKILCFWTGANEGKQTGGNGKSALCTLMAKALGEYYTEGKSSIITGKREKSESANSSIASFKNKRFIPFQEIDPGDRINMSVLKGLTGNDNLSVRDLYSKQEDIVPSWNLVTCCNIMPEFSSTDGGVKRRVRIIPFESKFVDDVHDEQWKDLKHVFPCDHRLKSRIMEFGPSMMRKLIEWFQI